jgi:hypothetical protein
MGLAVLIVVKGRDQMLQMEQILLLTTKALLDPDYANETSKHNFQLKLHLLKH